RLALIAVERGLVRGGKIVADRRAPFRRFHQDETPWLAQADGWRVRGQRQQLLDQLRWNRLRPKPPHVPPPPHELGEFFAEGRVELRALAGRVSHVASQNTVP